MKKRSFSKHLPFSTDGRVKYDHRMRIESLVKIITNLFSDGSNSNKQKNDVKILDMSSGRGELADLLTQLGYDVTCVDFDPECVKICKNKGLHVYLSDYNSLDQIFSVDEFDLVISSHSLEHLENPKKEFINLVNISKKYILIAIPNPLSLHNVFYSIFQVIGGVQPGHYYIWDHRHLKNFIETHLKLHIVSWHGDFVRFVTRRNGIRTLFYKFNLVRPIEMSLAKFFPFFSVSIIALCEKPAG